MEETKDIQENKPAVMMAPSIPLFEGKNSLHYSITGPQSVSSKGSNASLATQGMQVHPHPLNMPNAIGLKDFSSHHSACIEAKTNCAVGLGFLSDMDIEAAEGIAPKEGEEVDTTDAAQVASLLTGAPYIESEADEVLDPLTLFGFGQSLKEAVYDYEDVGNGYLEVARDAEGNIRWIGAIPAQYVHVVTQKKTMYYRVRTPSDSGTDRFFSRYGEEHKKWLFKEGPYANATGIKEEDISELIHFRRPTNRCQFYGYPDWLAGAISVDLMKKSQQYKSDFLYNRGVLDYILAVTGGAVDPLVWDEIVTQVKGTVGAGKNWKSLAVNIAGEKAKVDVHKLAQEQKTEDQYKQDMETFSQDIVTSHRVPPLLANILIPGKLGGTNEYMNSLISFQLLVVGPDQQIIQKTLASTLGNDDENGDLDLTSESFRLRTITSQINLEGLSTLGRMREEAVTSDRDLEDGVKD